MSRLRLRHPLRPFWVLPRDPPSSHQQNPPSNLIFPCICISGCQALGFGGAVPHSPHTMEDPPHPGQGGDPFCTALPPPAQHMEHSNGETEAQRGYGEGWGEADPAGGQHDPPRPPLGAREKQEATVRGGRQYGSFKTAAGKPWRRGQGSGCQKPPARQARGLGGLKGGPHRHSTPSELAPSPPTEGRGLPSASRLSASILGCNELPRSQASTWQGWVVFALEQRAPKEKGGGGERQPGDSPGGDRSGTVAQPCQELAGSQRRSRAGISLAPRLGCSSWLFPPE